MGFCLFFYRETPISNLLKLGKLTFKKSPPKFSILDFFFLLEKLFNAFFN